MSDNSSRAPDSPRNNPFSVPDSPPALIDPPKNRTTKVLHVLAFFLILVVWYGVVFLGLEEASKVLLSFHAIIFATLYIRNDSLFVAAEYMSLLWAIEIAFIGLVSFTLWRRSFKLTLFVLAFVVCWSVANLACGLLVVIPAMH